MTIGLAYSIIVRGGVLTLLLGTFYLCSFSQAFQRVGMKEGLSDMNCFSTTQDERGLLWIGTANGFVRYDGSEFKSWFRDPENADGLTGDEIRKVESDKHGRIYFTVKGDRALKYFDVESEEFKGLTDSLNHYPDSCSMGSNPAAVYCASQDSVWISNGNLWLYRPSLGEVKRFFPEMMRGHHVKSITPDFADRNHLWLGTSSSALQVNLKTGEFRQFKTVAGKNGCVTDGWSIQHILDEGEDELWAASWGGGLVKIDKKSGECSCQYFQDEPPYNGGKNIAKKLLRKSDDELWIATYDGIYIYHESRKEFRRCDSDIGNPLRAPEGDVLGITKTADEVVIFNTTTGLYQMDPSLNLFRRVEVDPKIIEPSLAYLQTPFKVSTGWIVPSGGAGLIHIDDVGIQTVYNFRDYSNEPDKSFVISNMARINVDEFLVHANRLIFRLNIRDWHLSPLIQDSLPYNFSLASFIDSKGDWWTSAQGRGVGKLNLFTGNWEMWPQGEEPNGILEHSWNQEIQEDSNGMIWVSGHHGLSKIDPSTSVVKHYPSKDTPWLPPSSPLDLGFDEEGYMWIATQTDGIIRRRVDASPHEFEQYTTKDGLPSNQFSSLEVRGDGVVVASGYPGAVVMKQGSQGKMDIHKFNSLNGLGDINLNHAGIRFFDQNEGVILDAGSMYFFNVDELFEKPSTVPGVYVSEHTGDTSFDQSDKDKIEIHPGTDYLTIKLGLVAYRIPNSVVMRYRINTSDEWSGVGSSRELRFDHLDPGSYQLEVETKYEGGLWASGLNLAIIVHPSFYQTWWFKVFLIILILLVSIIALRLRIKSVRKQEGIKADFQNRLAEVEMTALRAQMNPHFLFNSLNSINRYILKNDSQKASDYLTKFSRLMRLILQNSKKDMVPLSQELEALKLYVEMEAVRFNNKFRFEMETGTNLELDFIEVPPLILQPYVENSIWHGLMHKEEEGLLKISVQKENNGLLCTIEDNGIGRKKASELKSKSAQSHKSMGMRITSERMNLSDQLHHTNTDVRISDLVDTSGNPAGTRVEIRLQNA